MQIKFCIYDEEYNQILSIEGSIEGADNLLILAGWCKVFHQSTENFINGKFIELKIII